MADAILQNAAALNSLKRHQLVSLSKKYGLKASGKNGDMIERLMAHASSIEADFAPIEPPQPPSPLPVLSSRPPTPDPNAVGNPGVTALASPSRPSPDPSVLPIDFGASPPLPLELNKKASIISVSETWEMLSESGASLISPRKGRRGDGQGSVRSWKSAGNGESLTDFGAVPAGGGQGSSRSSRSGRHSVLALASSIRRNTTRKTSGIKTPLPKQLTPPADIPLDTEAEDEYPVPPSPASTVGIPRRHSRITLLERPSTLRLCSPTPQPPPGSDEGGALPFLGSAQRLQAVKDRRSMTPLNSRRSPPSSTSFTRKSMPVLHSSGSASIPSIYPSLDTFRADRDAPPVPTLPGSYPAPFVFGSPDHAVSAPQFSDAAQAILQKINEQLPEDARMGGEVLRGKAADMERVVKVDKTVGEGMWGLMERFEGKKDRFARSHEREFAKMCSISHTSQRLAYVPTRKHEMPMTPGQKRKLSGGSSVAGLPSAPNGAPLDDTHRAAKKTRLSNGPNYIGTLREAGRSMMTLLGDASEGIKHVTPRAGRKSRLSTKAADIRMRLSTFRLKSSTASKTAEERSAALHRSLRRRSAELWAFPSKVIPDYLPINPPVTIRRHEDDRKASTSAQTILSPGSKSSKTPSRKPIPEFGGASSTRTSTLDTARDFNSRYRSTNSSMRKQSADLIRNARRAPPPPSATATKSSDLPSINKRSSTLRAPTASSLARMQATVKPPPSSTRPLPAAPIRSGSGTSTQMAPMAPPPSSFRRIPTANPFGIGASRENLFDENFNIPQPSPTSPPAAALAGASTTSAPPAPAPAPTRTVQSTPAKRVVGPRASPVKASPLKANAAAANRLRGKNSGVLAIKSRGDLKGEVDMARRKKEVRARMERRGEERELMAMLGRQAE